MKISLIAALSKNHVIGVDNQLPWDLPKDMQFFKETTLNKPIIMGRKTYDSIGRPLPKRKNIVLTTQDIEIDGCEVVHNIDDAIKAAGNVDEIMVIGGGKIYELFFPIANRLYVTLVDTELEGHAYFPKWNESEWRETQRTHIDKNPEHNYAFDIVVLDSTIQP